MHPQIHNIGVYGFKMVEVDLTGYGLNLGTVYFLN